MDKRPLESRRQNCRGIYIIAKELKSDFEKELKRFVCYVYVPKSNVVSVKDAIRFKMNLSDISLLPPSPGAFHQHILRSYE